MAEILSNRKLVDDDAVEDSNSSPIIETSERLSVAFCNILNVSFKKFEDMLLELITKQEALFDKLSTQNDLTKNETVSKVHLTMLHTHQYYKKLLQIKKDMLELHAKVVKLKQRAKKVRENEEKEAENRRQRLHLLEKREQNIIAKPVSLQ